jgi:hypothetical protein
MDSADRCSPGSHPHSDRPNWRPAETADEYLQNCREGLEKFSQRRLSELMGTSRIDLWRWKQMAKLPDELYDHIFNEAKKAGIRLSTKALAQVAVALERGSNLAEIEACPYCGGVLRARRLVSKKLAVIVGAWGQACLEPEAKQQPSVAPSHVTPIKVGVT